jgi:hypothetical protein
MRVADQGGDASGQPPLEAVAFCPKQRDLQADCGDHTVSQCAMSTAGYRQTRRGHIHANDRCTGTTPPVNTLTSVPGWQRPEGVVVATVWQRPP